ncbi:biliverdin-producing heme oxygenase [Novosphingobium colocasiae]|uniref:biliverdin-producing heme oxygenase n=1 Tax=Novosphingobium colocasiae TaxID=1256513 RepID=UPI0035B09A51
MSRSDNALNATSASFPAVLEALRCATGPAHDKLDAAFGSLDLTRRDDLARFLRGHAIGMAAIFAPFRAFVGGELHLSCPDYPAALRADLTELGEDTTTLPRISSPWLAADGAALGLAYVVAGSRLGLAMLRKRGYHGQSAGLCSRYMENESGIGIWQALLAHMRAATLDDAHIAAACAAARDTFACFAEAFDASARSGERIVEPDAA